MIGKFLLKHVAGPLLGTIAAKIGEAVGDRVANKINPPDQEDSPPEGQETPEREDDDPEDESVH